MISRLAYYKFRMIFGYYLIFKFTIQLIKLFCFCFTSYIFFFIVLIIHFFFLVLSSKTNKNIFIVFISNIDNLNF